MANNYIQFSELIENLNTDACNWIKRILSADENSKWLKEELELSEDEELENWPEFEWKLEKNQDGITNLWLYSNEFVYFAHVKYFVQALIRKFMPDYVFALTAAEYCSRLRTREFGGHWMVISRGEVTYGSTWGEIMKITKEVAK